MNTVKKIKADVNNPTFTKIGTGLYEAKLFGHRVTFERVAATLWEARLADGEDEGRLLSVSENRSKAMREAFDNFVKQEQKRLEWVLSEQPMRTYGKRGNYKTDIKLDENTSQEEKRKKEAKAYIDSIVNKQPELKLVEKAKPKPVTKPAVENVDEDEEDDSAKIPKNLMNSLTTEQRLRLSKLYKIRKNKLTGKFAVAGYNMQGGFNKILGEFPTAGEAYLFMLQNEGINI